MSEKIIGYRFLFPEYKQAAKMLIAGATNKKVENICLDNNMYAAYTKYAFKADSPAAQVLEEAGLLNRWCKAVTVPRITTTLPMGKDQVEVELKDTPTLKDKTWYIDVDNPEVLVYHKSKDMMYGWDANGEWIEPQPTHVVLEKLDEIEELTSKKNALISTRFKKEVHRRYKNGDYVKWPTGSVCRITDDTPVFMHNHIKGLIVVHGLIPAKLTDRIETLTVFTEDGEWVPNLNIKDKTWYHNKASDIVVYHRSNGVMCGFTKTYKWRKYNNSRFSWSLFYKRYNWVEADITQVRDRLTQYAKKMDFINKDDVTSLVDNMTRLVVHEGDEDITVLKDDRWKKRRNPQLPTINGYKGVYNEKTDEIIYNHCAMLRAGWFTSSHNRNIKEMTLSSGIVIKEDHIRKIRRFLWAQPSFKKQLKEAQESGARVTILNNPNGFN